MLQKIVHMLTAFLLPANALLPNGLAASPLTPSSSAAAGGSQPGPASLSGAYPPPDFSPTETATPAAPTPEPQASPTVQSTPQPPTGDSRVSQPAAPWTVQVNPHFARTGSRIALSLRVKQDLGATALRIFLPAGLTAENDAVFVPDPAANSLTIDLDPAPTEALPDGYWHKTLVLAVEAGACPNAGQLLELKMELLVHGELWRQKNLLLSCDPQRVSPQNGGRTVGMGGKISVDFAPGAAPEPLDVAALPLDDSDDLQGRAPETAFKLEAANAAGKPVRRFNGEVVIAYCYDPALYAGNESALSLRYYDEDGQAWRALPSRVDTLNHILTAVTDHFTVFNPSISNFYSGQLPNLDAFQVSSFTGAATYTYPIRLPPAPAGFPTLPLSLSYNSQAVDGAFGAQASWVGMGWTLDTPFIQRDMHGTQDDLSDDTFSLTMNGMGGLLLKGADGFYHLSDNETFTRIAYNPPGFNGWVVWDQSGNRYEFGPGGTASLAACLNNTATQLPWRWSLTRIYTPYSKDTTGGGDPDRYFELTYNMDGKHYHYCNGQGTGADAWATYSVTPDRLIYPNRRTVVRFLTDTNRLD